MNSPCRMIIDVDTGIDDAMAIFYAVRRPGIKPEALTTTFGMGASGQRSVAKFLRPLSPLRRPIWPKKSPASVPGRAYAAGQRDAPGLGGKKGAPDKRTRAPADCSPSSRPAVGGGGDVAALFGCEAICASLTADPSALPPQRDGGGVFALFFWRRLAVACFACGDIDYAFRPFV